MNQRPYISKSRDLRREKIIKNRRDEEERINRDDPLSRRSSSERSLTSGPQSTYSRIKDNLYAEKTRPSSRDGQNSLIFRRQERGRYYSSPSFSKGSTPENSPGRISHTDSLRSEAPGRVNGGTGSYYATKTRTFREREYTPKRSGLGDNSHSFDDSRLLRLLQRLERDEDRERQVTMIRQLKEIFCQQDNIKTIVSHLNDIISTFEDLLHQRLHAEIKQEFITCLGILGSTLGIQGKSFFEWVFSTYNTSITDDARILILKTVHETLKNDKERANLTELMTMIMTNVQSALENADLPDLLVAIVDVILEISSGYPGVFANHFRDTVDILVGWHIDSTQTPSLTQYTSKALISFQQFWISDISFSVTLLGQFLEDMEAYAEDLIQTKSSSSSSGDGSIEEQPPGPDECIAKITCLIRVFTTVLKSLGNHVSPDESSAVTWDFLTEVLRNFLKYVMMTTEYSYHDDLITAANDCVCLLLSQIQSHSVDAMDQLLAYFNILQTQELSYMHEMHILSVLQVMTSFVKEVNIHLPMEFVSAIFAPSSSFQQLRFSASSKVQQQLLSVQHAVLSVKNVPVLEEAYKCILADIEDACAVLMDSKDTNTKTTSFVPSKAEIAILSSLCALAEIGNAKHSIIGMWALKPSFFDLMNHQLQPTSAQLAIKYPAVQYAILYSLYSHCQRHGHFISSSTLVNQNLSTHSPSSSSGHNSPILAAVPVLPPPSSGHLSKILVLLVDVLKQQETPYDSRWLAAHWASEIIDNLQHHLARLVKDPEFSELIRIIINTAFIDDPAICKTCCSVLQTLLKSAATTLSEDVLQSCYEVCILKLSVHDSEIQDLFATLLVLLPLDIITSGFPVSVTKLGSLHLESKDGGNNFNKFVTTGLDVWAARHGHMNRSCMGNFYSHHFRTIMAFILQGLQPKNKDWLLRLFFSCQPPERPGRVDRLLSQLARSSSAILWFWAVWEVAQTCVLYKLRTPLGKPQETFMAIEAAIKSYAKQSGKQETQSFPDDFEHGLLRVYLLLDLMEHLEKLMYNAYEGCAVALSTPPKTVRTFFRTNKGTCQEWLGRVRLATLVVALRAGQPAAALRQGYELIQEMKSTGNTQGADFEHLLLYVVKALIDLHCPEAILGLYVWCKDCIGRKFTWIKAAVDQAAGRFETAAHEYSCILHSLANPSSPQKVCKNVEELNKTNEKLKNGTSVNLGLSPTSSEEIVRVFGQLNIKDMTSSKLDTESYLYSFLINQVTECYINLGSWTDVIKWIDAQQKVKLSQNGINIQNGFCENDLSYLRALTVFEENIKFTPLPGNKPNLDFSSIDSKGISETDGIYLWEMRQRIHYIERLLLGAAVEYEILAKPTAEEIKEIYERMKQANSKILQLMKITALDWPPHVNPVQAALFVSTSALHSVFQKGRKNCSILLHENAKLDPPDYCCSTLALTLGWQNVWMHMVAKEQGIRPHNGSLLDLLLVTARLARKQQNLKLSQKLLLRNSSYLAGLNPNGAQSLMHLSPGHIQDTSNLRKVLKTSLEMMPTEKLVKMQREGAKLLHSWGDTEGAYEVLLLCSAAVSNKLSEDLQLDLLNAKTGTGILNELNSRSLLSLVKYLQQDSRNISDLLIDSIQDPTFTKDKPRPCTFLHTISEMEKMGQKDNSYVIKSFKDADLQRENIVGDADFLIGRLLQLSVHQCPSLAKAWSAFASWCYRWGRKVVDTANNGCMSLLPEEKAKILSLIPDNTNEETVGIILHIISNLHGSSGGEWDNQEMDYAENGAEEIRRQILASCPSMQDAENNDGVIEQLVDMWKSVVSRTYYYYKMAAQAYLQYLHLNGESVVKERSEDDNVTATLRLLRLVVKHASELRDVLEQGLAETPTAPWRGIIPQLFSRLNHPEPYVRQSISDLLCRVAQASPHLIVFPAVVGSLTLKAGPKLQEETSGLLGAYFAEDIEDASNLDLDHTSSQASDQGDLPTTISALLSDEEETEDDHQKTAIMQNCFTALVETLGRQDGRTISEVKNLVHELHRITLLWDELWLGTLNLHHNEVNRRISTLEDEITKVMNNASLTKEEKCEIIKEKHDVFIKPTLYVLEQLLMIISQSAETPHEQWFQTTFGKHIEDTLNKLKNPADPSRPQNSWTVFKQLHQLLQQRVQQQSRSHLAMDYISPVLASLKDTVIPMPGINTKVSSIITIQSVHNIVSILPTKTKPKKLAFIGSDGHKYTYLFKGLEDLHLDERIMQFLSIVNNMFAKNKRDGKVVYNARHYSVTPLGPRSGLIQWVDGATPLFGLYKRWQQREAMAQVLKGQNSVVNNLGPSTILRPSEIYYNKLTPLLKEKGIMSLENRKEWPLSILLDVLKELMEETPNDLLAKELWCSCSSVLEWWTVTQTYNHSTAVMSMIGYIIGLGDRHLDNVLVDLATGEVVHIDYNVCFEKGKNLRVPEKVPFRMTPNIETALGVTGVEGIFRVSCEHVLKVLRKGRETLLTLLEAFVYDPLVDWTPGNEGGYTGAVYGGRQAWAMEAKQTKQNMERDIAFSMFAIRVAEMRGEWLKNKDELLSAIPKLESQLQEWKTAQLQLQAVETQLQEACQEKALLEEAQANPNHTLYTLPKRYDETTIVKTTVKATKDAVKEKLAECKKWHNLHCGALSTVCGSELGKWCAEVASDLHTDTLSVAPVVEFLQSAGQGQLVQQCEHSESDLGAVLQQQRLALRNCVELLTTYATIVLQYGPAFREQNRSFKWQQWLENLLADFTVAKCQEVIADFHSQYGIESMDVASIQSTVALHYQLQSAIREINNKLLNVLERRHLEGVDDGSSLSSYVNETRSAISCFITENGEQGHNSLLCVIVTALCALNKRLLMMESAAAAAGDCLVDLTSWGGDWFLDEIYSMCGNIAQLMRILMDSWHNDKSEEKAIFHGVNYAHCIFAALEDLSLNFQNIILPEAVKTAQTQEPTVVEMATKLNLIIVECGIPLERLVSELETNMRNIIMEIQTNDTRLTETIKQLKNDFESLMKGSEPEISDLSRGQMLLMGFNGLFTKVDSDLNTLLSLLDNVHPPATWKKVDIVREAVALTPSVHLSATRAILQDIFFLKKLQAVQQFFHFCHDFAARLQMNSSRGSTEREVLLLSDHQLFKPVKVFIAEYVRQMVLGLPSQTVAFALCVLIESLGINVTAEIELRDIGVESKVSLEELGKKAVDLCMKEEKFSAGQLTQISNLTSNFDAAWRKEDLARRLEQTIVMLKGSLQRAQLQLARFQWLNEDLLVQGNIGPLQNFAVPTRASVMSEMRKTVQALLSLESAIVLSQERYLSLTASIEQRLKWAAGANPSLSSTQEEFEAAISDKTSIVNNAGQLSRELVNVCNAILHFEALRTRTTEALSSDSTFLGLINRCQETCVLAESCSSQVSNAEEHLIGLKSLPEKEGVNSEWMVSVMEKVALSLSTCREKLEDKKSASYICWDSLKNEVVNVRGLLSTHHRLMSDVRHILRTLAKHEEQELGIECKAEGHVHIYISMYKDFSEQISTVVRELLTEGQEMEISHIDAIKARVAPMIVAAAEVYSQLLDLAGPLGNRNSGGIVMDDTGQKSKIFFKHGERKRNEQNKKHSLASQAQELCGVVSPISQNALPKITIPVGLKKCSVMRDPRTGKVIQERNSYATNVWKRVKMKLDGRDPDPSKKSTIAEQVDFVIKEATNMENLAVLYEGWTPWV